MSGPAGLPPDTGDLIPPVDRPLPPIPALRDTVAALLALPTIVDLDALTTIKPPRGLRSRLTAIRNGYLLRIGCSRNFRLQHRAVSTTGPGAPKKVGNSTWLYILDKNMDIGSRELEPRPCVFQDGIKME